jgi:hypothetical protein
MSFVDCYLPYFRQQFITCPLLALLPFQPLFTESSREDQLLSFPPFSGVLTAPHPLCCVFLFSSLFIYLFIFFSGREVSLSMGLYWFISGWLWQYRMTLVAHLLVCRMSPKQDWSQCLVTQEPSCFLRVMWHGEALHRLGFRVSKF